jgi:hypothetical protein
MRKKKLSLLAIGLITDRSTKVAASHRAFFEIAQAQH